MKIQHLVVGLALAACTPQGQAAAGDLAFSKVACVMSNLDRPWQDVVMKCALQSGDFEKYERIFSEGQRKMAAARDEERKRLAAQGCAPDAGAR